MKTMNQRKATVSTVLAVLQERGVVYEMNGKVTIHEVIEDKDKVAVRAALFTMFRSGEVEMSEEAKVKYAEDSELKSYVSGLLNNWLRKAPEFNAGGKYKPKNPGSRPSDEQIKAMKQLLAITKDEADRAEIEQAIKDRQAELSPTPTVDTSKIPEALKIKLGIA